MSKKSDDSIERIFRQALTQYDTTFQKNDWLKMEKMLDEDAVRRGLIRSKRIKGIGYALTGLTVLFIAVYFLAFNPSDSASQLNRPATEMRAGDDLNEKGNVTHEKTSDGLLSAVDSTRNEQNDLPAGRSREATSGLTKSNTTEVPSPNAQTTVNAFPGNEETIKQKDLDQNSDTDSDVFKKKTEQKAQPSQNKVASPSATVGLPPGITDEVSLPGKVKSPTGKGIQSSEGSQKTKQPLTPSTGTDPSGRTPVSGDKVESIAELNKGDVTVDKSQEVSSGAVIPGTSKDTNAEDSLAERNTREESSAAPSLPDEKTNKPPFSPVVAKKDSIAITHIDSLASRGDAVDSVKEESKVDESKKEKSKPASRFSVAVLFAPEFSTTRLSHYSSPGESIGLRIGYQLSNRFHINTGIIRSTKKYKDSASEYSPNPNYWNNRTNGVMPEEIDSKCLVYEIPLDVQFNLSESTKSRVFVSVGIVSYLMVSQEYYYNFEQPNPGADTSWETSRTEKYWFGVGVLSAGYERYLSRSFALGIEPYLKTSLTEIGWPNIRLFSAGAYVTLRYRFMAKNP